MRWKNFGLDAGTRINLTGLTTSGSGTFEPRVGLTYRFMPSIAFKAAWGIYLQELLTVSDEDEIISIFEPWIITPDYIKAAKSIQYIAGFDIDITEQTLFSVEGYYKILQNIPIVNDEKFAQTDPDLISGSGESYGAEFLLDYSVEPFNITTSYTLSWAYRQREDWIYYPKYDARNSVNLILEFNIGNGWIASGAWNYSSGYPFTEMIGFYDKYFFNNSNPGQINGGEFQQFTYLGDKNLGRLPSYHRMDLSIMKKLNLSFMNMELGVSVINLYDRQNIFYFNRDTGEIVNMLPFLVTGTLMIEI